MTIGYYPSLKYPMSKKAEFWAGVNEMRKKGLSEMDIRKEMELWIPKKYKEAEN